MHSDRCHQAALVTVQQAITVALHCNFRHEQVAVHKKRREADKGFELFKSGRGQAEVQSIKPDAAVHVHNIVITEKEALAW